MILKQSIRIIVVSSLLLLGCIETGWAKDPVLDDMGNVITEAEIEANMGEGYRHGCVIGGGVLGSVPALGAGIGLWFVVTGGVDAPDEALKAGEVAFYLGLIATETAVIIASYYAGKSLDRDRAIKRIKARRRQQKEHAFSKQEMSGGFRLQLLKVTF